MILASPVGLAAPLLAGLTGSNVVLTRGLLMVSMLPLFVLAPAFLGVRVTIGLGVAALMLSPLLLGLLAPRFAARLASPVATASSLVTLVLVGAVICQTGLEGAGLSLVISAVLLTILSLAGLAVGAVMGAGPSERRAVTLALMTRNIGLPLAVALGVDMPELGVTAVVYGALLWFVTLAPLALRRA